MNAHSHIVRKIDGLLKSKLKEAMKQSTVITSTENIDLCADFIASGLLSVYQNWFNSDRSAPLKEVSINAGRLVIYGLKDFTDL